MRPPILFDLFKPIDRLSGVGPAVAAKLERLGIARVIDLLWHLPTQVIDRRDRPQVSLARIGTVVTLQVRVLEHHPPATSRQPYRIYCGDDSGEIALVFFRARPDYLQRLLPVGAERIVSGRVDSFNDQLQMAHPDHVIDPAELDRLALVEPVYPMTEGLSPKTLHKLVQAAVKVAPALPEWLEPHHRQRTRWPDWRAALEAVHAPGSPQEIDPRAPARLRLAYDELLANQLALMVVRTRQRTQRGRPTAGDGSLRAKAAAALPYALTGAQRRAIGEIVADMASDERMLRLLQGDVGSGKTAVALMAMLNAAEAGRQAALMAPTEILARQHFQTIAPLAAACGVTAAVLTGRDKSRERREALGRLADGRAAIAIGTHALFQEEVAFHDLALVIIDEQHRFGVHQRLLLAGKGERADTLVMTATPIPRTLALAFYGDMDQSILDEKPPGRAPVDTRAVPMDRLDEVVAGIDRAVNEGAKVYWVCPLVEESEQSPLTAAADRHAMVARVLRHRIGLVHGRLSGPEKDRAVQRLALPRDDPDALDVLVATTVIEVGVDVADATVMVIELAERFGLAQLHQLRGRVGRGNRPGTCLLLYQAPLGETARARLAMMRETDDGFRIAEEDLRLRGSGELLGVKQAGMPQMRVADLMAHADLLPVARDDARLAMERDPELASPRGQALRVLLYLFERDAAVPLLRSG
ncbi:MAG: ATP-dependent DNA helicase RecG [Alphaproteobacteria bacterium]